MQKIIDIHTHVFNLNYLPIRGVLQAHGVPKKAAKILEIILLKLTNSSYFEDKSNYDYKFLLDDTIPNFSQSLLDLSDKDVCRDLIERAVLHPDIGSNVKIRVALESLNFDDFESSSLFQNKWYIDLQDANLNFTVGNDRWLVSKLAYLIDKFMSGFYHLKWFRFMMRSEKYIYNNLIQNYDNIGLFIFHMMDADKFFHGKRKHSATAGFSIDYKIEKMQKLIKHSEGKLIGFVPFNPKRKDGLKLVVEALKFDGFKGVKFYPPLGYRATLNPNNTIEKRIDKFFKYCETNNVPVFTHCTPTGFEAVPKVSGLNSDPYYWEQLLKTYPDLILCLGHAGGVEGWFDPFEENQLFPREIDANGNDILTYAEKVYNLCISYKNVYCEVAFLDHVHNTEQKKNFKKRLKYLLELQTPNYLFKNKIMYGSDFHILFNHGIQYNYHDQYLEILKDIALQELIDKFFFKNAEAYLKI
ncbi:amidohydrolase family protein [Winogradskyella schleiferi]|uniref:amidohydrolase family protein n=1 Tax=Winogradskyella schleiferi TaxID=2686078 RepID=UPI0015C00437|nr:amidohydrolase family protein [Winogradskyella schleiferi]